MTSRNQPPPSAFARWGGLAARRPWTVVGAWVILLATLVALMIRYGGEYSGQFSLPGSESQKAADLLSERFPAQSGEDAQIVFASQDGPVTGPNVRAEIEAILVDAAALPGVLDLRSPYETEAAISGDGRTAFATLQYAEDDTASVEALTEFVEAKSTDGLVVEAGGRAVQAIEEPTSDPSVFVGLAAAAVILLIAFGSIVAMGVPLVSALVSLGTSVAALALGANVLHMDEFAPAFAAMIGVGVGIDYALLVITRAREGLHRGLGKQEAITIAVDTAGRSVLLAGAVVIIAMLSLATLGIPVVASLGIAGAVVVGFSALSAVTLLPALLALLGSKVDALSIPFLRSREVTPESTVWYRWSVAIQRRPRWFAAAGAGFLLVLAIPVLSMETSFTDAGNGPRELNSRRAYDLLAEGFGPGFNAPLMIAIQLDGATPEALAAVRTELREAENVQSVTEARVNDAGDTAVLIVYPESGPQDTDTNGLVHDLRDDVIPGIETRTGVEAFVTGGTAITIDVNDRIVSRTPLMFALVIGLSFVVLVVVFRSLLIPLKAALMNLLAIGAAYGVLVAVFQWGWFAGPFGVSATGPIETLLPIMTFAILFGLSMDYEVFLVSRIREEYMSGQSNSRAVALGLSTTARVITSAALVMIAAFGSFMIGGDRIAKEFGLGLSVAIFLDATIVRLLLVPAIMEVSGAWNWWLPSFLDRWLPAFDVEGSGRRARASQPAGVKAGGD